MEVAVRKGSGGLGGFIPAKVAEEKRTEVKLDTMSRVYAKFKKFRKVSPRFKERFVLNPRYSCHGTQIPEVLTPSQISQFLKVAHVFDEKPYGHTKLMVAKLMQNSYLAGNNDFQFDLRAIPFQHLLLAHHEGSEENPIKITVRNVTSGQGGGHGREFKYADITILGNVNYEFGSRAEHCAFNIYGNTWRKCGFRSTKSRYYVDGNTQESLGLGAKDSEFHVTGNVKDRCGKFSVKSDFIIEGNAGDYLGAGAEGSSFYVAGKVGKYPGLDGYRDAVDCTFRTTNLRTLESLVRQVPDGNRIEFIHMDGNQEIVRDNGS